VPETTPSPALLFPREAAKMMRRNIRRFLDEYVQTGLICVVIEPDGRMMVPKVEIDRYIAENLYRKDEQPSPLADYGTP
jgi:predicted site-specific integrase-resolvase